MKEMPPGSSCHKEKNITYAETKSFKRSIVRAGFSLLRIWYSTAFLRKMLRKAVSGIL